MDVLACGGCGRMDGWIEESESASNFTGKRDGVKMFWFPDDIVVVS